MKGLVTIFGGSGFVGSQIVRALAKRGARVRVAVRNPGRAYRLPMLGDVGQVETVQANIRDAASVARALEGAEACVNAVAVLYETGRQTFDALHVEGARTVANAAANMGVRRFVHISALGASVESPSAYGRTKAAGEIAVRQLIPNAAIVRPSLIFGPEDAFFNRFAAMALISPVLPLIGGGSTRFQPVYVGDVAAAVVEVLARSTSAASERVYELGGPTVHTFKELMQLMLKEIGRDRILLPIPFGVAGLMGHVGDLVARTPIRPAITSDQVELMRRDSVVGPGALSLSDLGVKPTALQSLIPSYLYRYRKGGQYADLTAAAAAAPAR